jgi:hypothetical protein
VSYLVEGAQSSSSDPTYANITYTTGDGTAQANEQLLPWKVTVTLAPGASFGLTAQLDDGGIAGTTYQVVCSVFGVGTPVPSNTAKGSFADVSCAGTVP